MSFVELLLSYAILLNRFKLIVAFGLFLAYVEMFLSRATNELSLALAAVELLSLSQVIHF